MESYTFMCTNTLNKGIFSCTGAKHFHTKIIQLLVTASVHTNNNNNEKLMRKIVSLFLLCESLNPWIGEIQLWCGLHSIQANRTSRVLCYSFVLLMYGFLNAIKLCFTKKEKIRENRFRKLKKFSFLCLKSENN